MQKPDYNLHLKNVKNAKYCKCRVVYVSARQTVVIWCHLAANRRRKHLRPLAFWQNFFLMILPKKQDQAYLQFMFRLKMRVILEVCCTV